MKNNYILTAGYGWSGSSVIVDLLKEYKDIIDSDVEFRLIKDAHGLLDLRNHLINQWDVLSVNTAIKDFLFFANCVNRSSSKTIYGLDYKSKIGPHFIDETKKFIAEITNFVFFGNSWMFNLNKSRFEVIIEKILRKLHINNDSEMMRFCNCTEKEFDCAVRKYLDSLFNFHNGNKIILDQAISPVYPESSTIFFDNTKMIIVDRDPRDIYVNLVNTKSSIGAELSKTHDVSKYIKWHLAYRKRKEEIKSLPYVKQFQFEVIVCNYDKSVKEVEQFLGLSDKDHIAKRKYFDPDISIKNVGAWKNYPYQDEIRIIEKELPDYLYTK